MSTITWAISQLNCLPQSPEGQDYVVIAHWQCVGAETSGENAYRSEIYGTSNFAVAQGESFTPYANLTQDQVLGWCWANGVNKQTTEAAVQQALNNQINPPIVSPPLPWSA